MNFSETNSNRNILVVDDEPDILKILEIYLKSFNWNVTLCESPSEALESAVKNDFFLVITDIAMPEIDGYELIKQIKKTKAKCEFILMTGFGYNPNHTLVKIKKKYDYPLIFKPFDFKKNSVDEYIETAYRNYNKFKDSNK